MNRDKGTFSMSNNIALTILDHPADSYLSTVYSELILALFKNEDHAKFAKILLKNEDHPKFAKIPRIRGLDVNHFYGDPFNGTLLDIACEEKNRSAFVNTLIRCNVNINAINHLSKKAPIHTAVENSDTDTISLLVENTKLHINIQDGNGNTPLHIAAKLGRTDVIDILFDRIDLDANVTNLTSQTPLYLALEQGNTNTVRLLLQRLDIDMYSQKYQGRNCRQIIKEKYPHIGDFIDENRNLFGLLECGKTAEFIQLAKKNRSFLNSNDGQYTYLQFACQRGLTDVVETLLRLVTNPNARCAGTDSPLLIAIYNGSDDILKALLGHENISLEPVRGKNLLHAVFDSVTNQASRSNQYFDCLQTLLHHYPPTCWEYNALHQLNINYPDYDGNTILHRAVRIRDERFVTLILQKGAYIGQINNRGDFAVKLIEPSLFRQYLDTCITSNRLQSRDVNYRIIFDYKMLKPPIRTKPTARQLADGTRSVCETDPLLQMCAIPELRDLLKHPVITSFLDLKWQTICPFFRINFIFHLIFLLVLTFYVYLMCESCRRNLPIGEAPSPITSGLWGVSLFFCALLSIRELCQFIVLPRPYTRSLENWFEIGIIVVIATLLICPLDFSLQRQLGAVAILACGFETILLLGKHPKLTTYIEMFKTVTWNFSNFLLWYAILIFAFSFSFFILLNDGSDQSGDLFRNPWTSFLKTIVMMTGEFEFQSLPFDKQGMLISYIIFLLFTFLIAIVLYGLLNGLAVSDIQAIRADAEIIGIVSRIKSIIHFESITVRDPFPYTNLFNKINGSCCYPRWLFSIFSKINFFPNTLPKAKVHVSPNENNEVYEQELLQICSKTYFSWHMDPQIVKAAKVILERNENRCQTTIETAIQSDQIRQLIEGIDKRNEHLLLEIIEILKKKL